jgi:putative MATE family efflux protein
MTADAASDPQPQPVKLSTGGRGREVWNLALPIIGAMSSQNVLNLVDAAMVSHIGPTASAAVGLGSMVNFMAFSAITGLSTAVQAMAARRYGEGRYAETAIPLNGGIFLSLLIGVPLALLLILHAAQIFAALDHDAEVVRQGTVYLQCRLFGIAAIGINFSFRGYWSAVKKTVLYLCTLFGICCLNILLDWLLIFGKLGLPELGVKGAGLASVISACCGTLAYCAFGWRYARGAGFFAGLPRLAQLLDLLRIGLPACAQQLLYSGGFVTLFWIVGQVGTDELAVSYVLVNITLTAVLPALGFGLASATFCGQALGRHDVEDAYRWAWDVYRASWWVYAAMALPMLLLTDPLLRLFFGGGHDAVASARLLALGETPLRMIGAGVVLDGLGFVLMQSLLGVGASRMVMLISVGLQWGLFLPLAWLVGPVLLLGLLPIWGLMLCYRGAQTLAFIAVWRSRSWARIAL